MVRFATSKPKSTISAVSTTKTTSIKSTTKSNSTHSSKDSQTQSCYYGEHTISALENFEIGEEIMPHSLIKAMAIFKKAAILANEELKLISKDKSVKIIKAIDEVIEGKLEKHFPLSIWQSGAGTHSNHNMNEVVANRAIELAGGKTKNPINPTDDINKSQIFNDTFSVAMRISAVISVKNNLIPSIKKLRNTFWNKAKEFESTIKIGRTHLMDAFIITLGQEFDSYVKLIDNNLEQLEFAIKRLYELPIGGKTIGIDTTVVDNRFAGKTIKQLVKLTKFPFIISTNKLNSLSNEDAFVFAHSTVKTLATSLFKIANDIHLLASGPRNGFNELILPESEITNQLLPGKINPLHCETLSMACVQVMGNDATISIAGANGKLELNTYKPLIIYNFLQSVKLISDASNGFEKLAIKNIKYNKIAIEQQFNNTLISVRELVPHIGYENATKIAQYAYKNNTTIREAVEKLKLATSDDVARVIYTRKS